MCARCNARASEKSGSASRLIEEKCVLGDLQNLWSKLERCKFPIERGCCRARESGPLITDESTGVVTKAVSLKAQETWGGGGGERSAS